MITQTLGNWAAKDGIKKAYTMVSDYAPGHRRRRPASSNGFKAGGGEIVGSVRMAVANPDFSAFVQRAKDLNPEAIFVFIPGGAQPAAIGKAFAERGIDTKKSQGHGHAGADRRKRAQEHGRRRARHHHRLALRLQPQVKTMRTSSPPTIPNSTRNPNFFSVGGYDGMPSSTKALKKTKGNTDGDRLIAADKGMKWDSPRGPMSIDPETRDIVADHLYPARSKRSAANWSTSRSTRSRT